MTTRNLIIGLWLLALASAGIACGDSKDEAPPDSGGSFTQRDSGVDDEEEEDAGSDEESDAGSKDAGNEDTLTASEKEAKAKGWVEGCFKKPTKNAELLNSCATGWRLFDESLYPADWKKGSLPTLP
jgi:hypothetical protein